MKSDDEDNRLVMDSESSHLRYLLFREQGCVCIEQKRSGSSFRWQPVEIDCCALRSADIATAREFAELLLAACTEAEELENKFPPGRA